MIQIRVQIPYDTPKEPMEAADYIIKHRWAVCDMCGPMVICGKCGNNCCNGGYGEIFGPDYNVMVECDVCPSAYAFQKLGPVSDNAST